jgi:hypothetical protein
MITENEIRQILREQCDLAGGVNQWARYHHMSGPAVSQAINGRRPHIGQKIYTALGYVKIVRFIACNPVSDLANGVTEGIE